MKKVLVANRGEIACRVIRAVRSLGLSSVAVFSEADEGALHTVLADEAVGIGPSPPIKSYLVPENLIEAALKVGADAIHPGYGFLAENAAFAEAIEAAGLRWIGPRPESIEDMGLKDRGRDIAARAGVPVVRGSRPFELDALDGLESAASEVGYPLLVKAAGGGGGIGMQVVNAPDGLSETVARTQTMAAKMFANGTVYLERYIAVGRHVEVQVFGDGNGDAVHFLERDCSLQRRYQKVIEEAPAPGISDELRHQMTEAALRLCRQTRYRGAGTVEFLLEPETGQFFFLEMNTRIQVEHPVTEMITGADLVAMQIELASGCLSGLDQSAVTAAGHAIECRLYAEKPAKNFMPSPGTLARFELPRPNNAVRVETGYREGDKVTVYYDPLLAKLVAHGPTRAHAIDTMRLALADVVVDGISTNRDFLQACLNHPEFVAGQVSTQFIDTHKKALLESSVQI